MQQMSKSSNWKSKLKYLTVLAALPAALFTFSAQVTIDRNVASLPQFRNWGLSNQVSNSHIHAIDAWKIEQGSRDIVVAVVDTGIDPAHPDLKNNLWKDPKTGYYGWDFVKGSPNPKDDHGHGTHVSGILGAVFNPKAGISGVSPRVSIMPVKYYSEQNSGSENLKNSILALNWAIDHKAKIINYSGGGPEYSAGEYAALKRAQEAGVLLVAAAGNENQDTDQTDNFYYPCAYKLDNIICVAATNIRNGKLPSSNWGKSRVDVAAPGENILSTAPGGKYAYMSGTSQATAFVTGIAALLLSKDRSLKPHQIKDLIRQSVDQLPSLKGKVLAGGKVNAAQALVALEKMDQIKTPVFVATEQKDEIKIVPRVRVISSPHLAKKESLKPQPKVGEVALKLNEKRARSKEKGALRSLAF